MRGSQRLCVGCRLWGGVQPLVQWKRQCRGVGSVTRLCTERGREGGGGGGGSKGVYTEGIRGHYCRFFRASASLSRQRENTEPLTVCHCDKPFHGCLHLSPSSPHHPITPCVVWWTTYHSIPSSRPVPFTAEVLKICHFLSLRAGRPRELATSVGVMACSMSCLFAKTIRMAFFSSSS